MDPNTQELSNIYKTLMNEGDAILATRIVALAISLADSNEYNKVAEKINQVIDLTVAAFNRLNTIKRHQR